MPIMLFTLDNYNGYCVRTGFSKVISIEVVEDKIVELVEPVVVVLLAIVAVVVGVVVDAVVVGVVDVTELIVILIN